METERTEELKNASSEQLALTAVKILIEKKAIDVKLYDVRGTAAITDFYIIATGKSSTHVASLAGDVDYFLNMKGKPSERIEGKKGNSWLLIDYIDVIVNVFDKESRAFYNFERLMPEGSLVDISDIIAEVDKKFGVK